MSCSVEDVRKDPYPLMDQFEWCLCDLQVDKDLTQVYDLLRQNYVEDDDAMFRFCYSREFIKWALCPPGYHKEWHIGVRVKANQKLVRHPSTPKAITRRCFA
jgi:glycylpeptide N-tetradecanoyltransferase